VASSRRNFGLEVCADARVAIVTMRLRETLMQESDRADREGFDMGRMVMPRLKPRKTHIGVCAP
jgi:hypothetical protein